MPAFGQTFLLQYKVARRTTARVGANAKFWDVYNDSYYRFNLHRDARGAYAQHQLLLDATAADLQPLYCAPLISSRADLVQALRTGSVVDQSALISVASLGPAAAGAPHSVTYPVDEMAGPPTLHSEPRRGERLHWEELRDAPRERLRPLNETTFDAFSTLVLEGRFRRRRRERVIRAEDSRAAAYLRASAIALDELNATLVVLPAPID
jgi:hypothetical protein